MVVSKGISSHLNYFCEQFFGFFHCGVNNDMKKENARKENALLKIIL